MSLGPQMALLDERYSCMFGQGKVVCTSTYDRYIQNSALRGDCKMESSSIHGAVSGIDLGTGHNQPTTVICETNKNGIHQRCLSFFIPKINVDSSVDKQF